MLRSTVARDHRADSGWTPCRQQQNSGTICHNPRVSARRPFVITPYAPGAEGVLTPSVPAVCPREGQEGKKCRVFKDHWRDRATGPCFPLTVVRCRPHGIAFTLYPPGHVPYGRQAVAPAAPGAADDAKVFSGTLFGAALDASEGKAWSRACLGGSDRWWGTQGRRLARGVLVVGVEPATLRMIREQQECALGVGNLLLIDGVRIIGKAPGYRARGQAVRSVLDRLSRDPRIFKRVSVSGHLAGLWGAPCEWDPQTRHLRSWAFPQGGTGPPGRPRGPRRASTNSGHGAGERGDVLRPRA